MHDPDDSRACGADGGGQPDFDPTDFELGDLLAPRPTTHWANTSTGHSEGAGSTGRAGRRPGPLDRLAEQLDDAVPPGSTPVWVRLSRTEPVPRGAASDLGPEITEIDPDLSSLLGWRAPPTCLAVGVVADGLARPTETGRSDESATCVRIVCLIDRWGRIAGRLQVAGGPTVCDPPEGGKLLDALLRALGQPTRPPDVCPAALLDRMWLGKILNLAEKQPRVLSWPRVRGLHPAAEVLRAADMPVDDRMFELAIRAASRAWTWERIRAQAASGDWDTEIVSPELAAWMDEGMFSRWVMAGTRTCNELLAATAGSLAPTARRRLEGLLRQPQAR